MQQQLTGRISAEVQFNRRWWEGQYVSRNLALTNEAASWTSSNITAPVDPRLPGGGGYAINGLYDVNPALFGQTNYQVQPASNYGNEYQRWDGVDVTVAMRPSKGFTFQGGTSTGQTVQDLCGVAGQVPEALQAPQALTIGVSTPGFTAFTASQAGFTPMQVLPSGVRVPDAAQRVGRLSGATGGRRDFRDVPKQARPATGGEL